MLWPAVTLISSQKLPTCNRLCSVTFVLSPRPSLLLRAAAPLPQGPPPRPPPSPLHLPGPRKASNRGRAPPPHHMTFTSGPRVAATPWPPHRVLIRPGLRATAALVGFQRGRATAATMSLQSFTARELRREQASATPRAGEQPPPQVSTVGGPPPSPRSSTVAEVLRRTPEIGREQHGRKKNMTSGAHSLLREGES